MKAILKINKIEEAFMVHSIVKIPKKIVFLVAVGKKSRSYILKKLKIIILEKIIMK